LGLDSGLLKKYPADVVGYNTSLSSALQNGPFCAFSSVRQLGICLREDLYCKLVIDGKLFAKFDRKQPKFRQNGLSLQ
jgi:hypothetical protein